MVSKFHSNLSKDLSLILNDADDFNVIIQVGENEHIKEFRAHSVILRARSPYFKSALSNEWITKKNNMIMFNKPNITPTVFDMIIKYIYTGELDLTKPLGEDILGLLVASDELLLEELFKHLQDYLIENRLTWVQQNFVLVLHTVFKLATCKKLQDYCLESICINPQPFITSKNFTSLDKDILYGLLKRDDLEIEEVVAWECLIKWGIEQTPGLGSENNDRLKWNDNDYEALKKTLDSFIPLIRFVELSSSDYFDKVRPYKAIIPNYIYEEVEEFYFKGTLPRTTTLPPRTGSYQKIDSNVIKPKLSGIINNWINRKNANATRDKIDSSYNFNLIYRKSRDGNNNLRNNCTGHGAILILIKVKHSDKIFGGYNPVGWQNQNEIFGFNFINNNNNNNDNNNFNNLNNNLNNRNRYVSNQFSLVNPFLNPNRRRPIVNLPFATNQYSNNQYLFTTESFIFSFENNDDTNNMKISRVIESSYAICDYPGMNGINFGENDLKLEDDYLSLSCSGNYENNLSTNSIYRDFGYGEYEYEVEEIEAFSVDKKLSTTTI